VAEMPAVSSRVDAPALAVVVVSMAAEAFTAAAEAVVTKAVCLYSAGMLGGGLARVRNPALARGANDLRRYAVRTTPSASEPVQKGDSGYECERSDS
jgi:hypothetical protein